MATDQQALLLQVSADISRLEKQFAKAQGVVDKGSRAMERRAQQASTNLERFFGKADPAKALDKVFDATRFKVLDSGVARIGLFGSALETLGPAGFVAAAGIGALGAAFAGAREAAKFADDINDTADRLHVTTDALQEYRYAIRLAGGEEKGADEALEAFSVTLGKAQQGLAKSQRAFLALGFTKEQIKSFSDADTALKAVTERIQGLPSQQQDAIIQQLGLDGLKPLIEGGIDSMQRLREEAHKVGIVMDAELVKRGGDLNDQFETVSKVIDVQLKSALVDLGPVLVDILKMMAELAKDAADVADHFRAIEDRRTSLLKRQRELFVEQTQGPLSGIFGANARKKIAQIDAELAKRAEEDKPKPLPKPTRNLIDTSRTGGAKSAPRDTNAERTEQVNAAVAQAAKALLDAESQLTDDIETRSGIERQIAAKELEEQLARIEKQKADLDDDKGLTAANRKLLKGRLDEAETSLRKASEAKVDLIARRKDWALEDQADETRQQIRDAELANLEIASSLATTAAERRRIEEQILKIKQDERTHELGKQLSRQVETGAISQETADRRFAAGLSQNAAERVQLRAQTEGPTEAFIRANRGAEKFQQTLEEIGVHGFESLADSLGQAIATAQDLGDVVKSVFRQMIADVLSATIKNVGASIFASLPIPGFASGTNYAPGGFAIVGEHGPELVNLSKGSQVVPASRTLSALQNLRPPTAGAKAGDVNLIVHVDASGAIPREEIETMVRRGSQAAVTSARQLARQDASRSQYQQSLNS